MYLVTSPESLQGKEDSIHESVNVKHLTYVYNLPTFDQILGDQSIKKSYKTECASL